jgi:(E)-4-hydroxy-3-methyl-but-2-enyl pyrophosphate reductase
MGYGVAIIGDPEHPEVKGLVGYSRGKGIVINKGSDIAHLPKGKRICVVSQTTMDEKTFQRYSSKIARLYDDVIIFNTICDSTSKRQEEVLELCKKVEAMIVIGGKNSANTTRLAEISRNAGVKAYHIETESELNLGEIEKFKAVGVTAGASTPKWIIEKVLGKLKKKA